MVLSYAEILRDLLIVFRDRNQESCGLDDLRSAKLITYIKEFQFWQTWMRCLWVSSRIRSRACNDRVIMASVVSSDGDKMTVLCYLFLAELYDF